jgi:formylglycine-generating enzyme required for sulfatase activity
MSGNVWEWTLSAWRKDRGSPEFKYPYVPGDGRERVEDVEKMVRVLRGGTYVAGSRRVRCADRRWRVPDYRGGSLGFRVVVAPFSSDSEPSDL